MYRSGTSWRDRNNTREGTRRGGLTRTKKRGSGMKDLVDRSRGNSDPHDRSFALVRLNQQIPYGEINRYLEENEFDQIPPVIL